MTIRPLIGPQHQKGTFPDREPDPHPGPCLQPGWLQAGHASADRRIRIWDALNGVEQLAMTQDGSVTEVVFSSDGQVAGDHR